MSGTSADGIDAAIIRSDGTRIERTNHAATFAYPSNLREAILAAAVDAASYLAEPNRRAQLIQKITDAHCQAVASLREAANFPKIDLIGFHGQTVYHNPALGRTIQLGDGGQLAKAANIPVIYDFRAADMEAGGQGAPLAPIYHQLILQKAARETSDIKLPALFINIGGVSNASFVMEDNLEGYDIGPGNALIDDLCQIFYQKPFDKGGEIAASAKIYIPFIERVLADPFFKMVGPRALDRAYFHSYLSQPDFASLPAADQIATVTALTARAAHHCIAQLAKPPKAVLIAGGGAHNHTLMAQLKAGLPRACKFIDARAIGCSPDFAEAELMALLAARWQAKLPSSFPETTGVTTPQICGVQALPPQPQI
jgi:anhydro-N-acetylmuramic acid kinase